MKERGHKCLRGKVDGRDVGVEDVAVNMIELKVMSSLVQDGVVPPSAKVLILPELVLQLARILFAWFGLGSGDPRIGNCCR